MIHLLTLFQIISTKKMTVLNSTNLYSIICQTMKFSYIAKNPTVSEVSRRVPGAGLEPARYCYQRILSPLTRLS